MEPQFFNCGNGFALFFSKDVRVLQWSRSFSTAEIRVMGGQGDCPNRFNGAAVFQLRKSYLFLVVRVVYGASMEPQFFNCGNVSA